MKRRELLRNAAVVLGSAVSGSVSRAVLAGVDAAESGAGDGSLTPAQLKTVAFVCERIIPTTDTPGAVTAGVPKFINSIYSQWYNPLEKTLFEAGLSALDQLSTEQFKKTFDGCTVEQQIALLQQAEEASADAESELGRFFSSMKELTVLGYYTSEVGATQELKYNPMPMRYQGDFLFADVGRQWSS